MIRVEASLPFRFAFGTYSPMLDHTGSWVQAVETIAAEKKRDVFVAYEIVDIQSESEAISSFYLRRADGKALATHEPGQFLPIRLTVPGAEAPLLRTYTVSNAPTAIGCQSNARGAMRWSRPSCITERERACASTRWHRGVNSCSIRRATNRSS